MNHSNSPKDFCALPRIRNSQAKRPPRYEPFMINTWFVAAVAMYTIGFAVAIEVVLRISIARNGYYVTEKNIVIAHTQFLTSFFPTLLVVPLVYFWSMAAQMLRWYQPYTTLAAGNAPASHSILLNYLTLNQLSIIFYSVKYKHYLIFISTLMALTVVILQPLAGSLFHIGQVPYTSSSTAISIRTVALSPDVAQLNAFLSAAGYIDAAVYGDLGDPPYVHGVWTAASFEAPPGLYLNGTLAVNVTGVQTHVNCVNPTSLNLTSSGGDYTAQATFPNACFTNLVFAASNGNQQYSVMNASNCAPQGQNIEFQPVVFWYYFQDTSASSAPEVAAVFCAPQVSVFATMTSMDLSNGTLGNCTIVGDYVEANNVTGSPLNGQTFNGVVFNQSSNVFIAARALAINSGVPGTIYRFASLQPGGMQSVFNDPYGWLNATSKIYTQHLAIAAQDVYLGPNNETIPAILTTNVPRLFVGSFQAHMLSVLLIVNAVTGFIVHFLHARSRRKLWLTTPPGSIASIVAMTSRSGFGKLLHPYDDEQHIRTNLTGLKFCLDPYTGEIVEEDISVHVGEGISLLGGEGAHLSPMFGTDGSTPLSPSSFKDRNETP
ncbi:hypothetical protein V8B97DRAFT_1150902 [Scleroderma yunnanense]